jgi:hypothetical protein
LPFLFLEKKKGKTTRSSLLLWGMFWGGFLYDYSWSLSFPIYNADTDKVKICIENKGKSGLGRITPFPFYERAGILYRLEPQGYKNKVQTVYEY